MEKYDTAADDSINSQRLTWTGVSVKRVKLKRVLVGHSLGAACAAAEFIDNPEVRRTCCCTLMRTTELASLIEGMSRLAEAKNQAYRGQWHGCVCRALLPLFWWRQPLLRHFFRPRVILGTVSRHL
jgi:hypothetical protein